MNRACMAASVIAVLLVAQTARARPDAPRFGEPAPEPRFSNGACAVPAAPDRAERVWQIDWLRPAWAAHDSPRLLAGLALVREPGNPAQAEQTTTRRPQAFDYGTGYNVRLKIHKYASIATVPLFVAETWLGQSLYNNPGQSESKRGAHGAVAASIGVLFGVNSVTGVWNLVESRRNPAGRTRRTVHSILMLVSDAGFVATGLLAPDEEGGEEGGAATHVHDSGQRSTHRAVALSSMGVALAGYLMMLVWKD